MSDNPLPLWLRFRAWLIHRPVRLRFTDAEQFAIRADSMTFARALRSRG